MDYTTITTVAFTILALLSCSNKDSSIPVSEDCSSSIVKDTSVGECNETLNFLHKYEMSVTEGIRSITANSIPDHKVGLFGMGQGSLNPNIIRQQNETYQIAAIPTVSSLFTPLLSTSSGPQYSFGILFSGVELDPIPAEPFPHNGIMDPNVNWEWNLEALNVNLGLDCNYAHVQPQGKYHYHGKPTLYLENLEISNNTMSIIGYAADGFPIYYKYAYTDANNTSSAVVEMTSSYQLKSGERPGDGVSAPCDIYNGVYSNDYEYIDGLGSLDEANGRNGKTPEYPLGTYYYVITDDFPSIPRSFRGTPSSDFRIGN